MVEIRYGEHFEIADLAGLTVSEARAKFQDEFDIPDKAVAKLNSTKVKRNVESDTVLNDDDTLNFVVVRSRVPFLVGAVLLALAVTGGVFAAGFINATATLNASGTLTYNFAEVAANQTAANALTWNAWGYYKGSIATTDNPVFTVDTATSNYTGDLVVSVSLGNGGDLAKCYRLMALKIGMKDSTGTFLNINEDSTSITGNSTSDWVMLTLDNGSVSMFPKGISGGDTMTVVVMKGFYITHARPFSGWGSADPSPMLFCEVAQR